jgi:hypothetical protein
MRIAFLFLSLSLLLNACRDKNKLPGHILPQAKMQELMWDMMRADQYLLDHVVNKDSTKKKDEENIKLYQQVLGFHKVTQQELKNSLAYYQAHPLLLKAVMDSINNRKPEASTYMAQPDSLKGKQVSPLIQQLDSSKPFKRKKPLLPS